MKTRGGRKRAYFLLPKEEVTASEVVKFQSLSLGEEKDLF